MTENEALKSALKKIIAQEKSNWGYIENFDIDENWAVRTAIEHVEQYRKIGTPEELKAASKYLQLVKKHGTVGKAIDACAEYEGIGTVEECREAMEKQRRKIVKNQYGTNYVLKAGYCPVCGCGVTARWDYCQCCGQKLNWRMHEKAH